jgi:spore coat-associated protein N
MLKKKLVMAVFTAIFGASLIGAGTSAIYTSQADNTGNTFASGTVVVELDKDSTQGEHYFDVDNMAPGDKVEAEMWVENAGSLDLRFVLSHTFTGDLAGAFEDSDVEYFYNDGGQWLNVTGPLPVDADSNVMAHIKVVVTLPLDTGNEYQGKSAMMKIQVDAEQVKNNPIVPVPAP